ncbi:hypothetical+protein [Methylocapsa aurea]
MASVRRFDSDTVITAEAIRRSGKAPRHSGGIKGCVYSSFDIVFSG